MKFRENRPDGTNVKMRDRKPKQALCWSQHPIFALLSRDGLIYKQEHICTYIHTYINTYIHTYIHTHAGTHRILHFSKAQDLFKSWYVKMQQTSFMSCRSLNLFTYNKSVYSYIILNFPLRQIRCRISTRF